MVATVYWKLYNIAEINKIEINGEKCHVHELMDFIFYKCQFSPKRSIDLI